MQITVAEKLLNLPKKYSLYDVKKSWKIKMKQYHPDLGHPPEKALELNKAKCIILDNFREVDESIECDCKKKGNFCQPFDNVEEEEEFWNCVIDGTLDDYFSNN
tara:strand:+ start:3308 stop:3619 length:312 start_codon:yes stop_codon:yes gene_type:complete